MLTQKQVKAVVPADEFSKDILGWLTADTSKLEANFAKKFPRSRNKFNVQLKNVGGSLRTVVVTSTGQLKFDKKNTYKNVVSWATARRLGCPA